MKNEVKHTAHSSYRCEYHVVFAPKYRRKVIYKTLREDIIEIIKKLCREMKVEIMEGEACPDHIHFLVSIDVYKRQGLSRIQRCHPGHTPVILPPSALKDGEIRLAFGRSFLRERPTADARRPNAAIATWCAGATMRIRRAFP